jgi:sterol desaturase/sphingolipid hydroxylase (fatty acid hydroxylase superfamily)
MLQTLRMAVWLFILVAIFVPLERLFAVERQKVFRRQFAVDLAYYFLNSLGTTAALALGLGAVGATLHRIVPLYVLEVSAGLPFWARVLASLVVGEIGFYWGHRWSHEIPFLWRFHAVHHSAEQLDFLSNTRAHPIDMAFTRLCGFVPLYVLGLAEGVGNRTDLVPAIVVLVATVWGFFIHANIRWRFGWLESVVTTPAFHRWHHTNDIWRDHNYAATLPFMDRVFGTYHMSKEWPPSYGIDAKMSPSLANQLLRPLAGSAPDPAEAVHAEGDARRSIAARSKAASL